MCKRLLDPLVWYQIEVIKPRTNPEMYEPKYRCTLCCVTAEIDPIYQHLVGAKHRTKYIKNILGQPVHTFKDLLLSRI